MKEGIEVTKGNIATILGDIKHTIGPKGYVATRNAYTDDLEEAKGWLAQYGNTWNFTQDSSQKTLLSQKTGIDAKYGSMEIKEVSKSQFIAIYAGNGNAVFIRIGDKVHTTDQGIFIFKKESSDLSIKQKHIVVMEYN